MDRVWTFERAEWDPKHRWLPVIGGDEFGRRTIVLPIPFGGYVVFAYWTCRCEECHEMREQTARFLVEYDDDWSREEAAKVVRVLRRTPAETDVARWVRMASRRWNLDAA